MEDPDVIVYPDYVAVCGRDCFTAECGISPHDYDDAIVKVQDEVDLISKEETEDDDNTSGVEEPTEATVLRTEELDGAKIP